LGGDELRGGIEAILQQEIKKVRRRDWEEQFL